MLFTDLIYTTIYRLVHFIYTIIEFLWNAVDSVRQHKVTVVERHEFPPQGVRRLRQCINDPPVHLTVLLGNEQPSYEDLANIIMWCLIARISFVSFHDHKGTLKKNEQELRYQVDKRKKPTDNVIWHGGGGEPPRRKNGFTVAAAGTTIHVKVLQSEDGGRASIVRLVMNDELPPGGNHDDLVDCVDAALRQHYEFPDPELAVCCGNVLCLFGYPPWQIRVTEFVRIRTHCGLSWDTFVGLLERYSKCEQRLGK